MIVVTPQSLDKELAAILLGEIFLADALHKVNQAEVCLMGSPETNTRDFLIVAYRELRSAQSNLHERMIAASGLAEKKHQVEALVTKGQP